METKFQTSFIPKQPVTDAPRHHASAASLIFLVSFILFMASVAAAGGDFIYGQIMQRNITQGTSQLSINKNAFDPNTIQEITLLNDRINSVYTLLKNHRSVSTLFQVLENTTLKSVQFTDFSYDSSGDKITISMKGKAFNYETVARQSKSFTDPTLTNVFKSPIFGDLTLDSQGDVSFSFSATVDPVLVSYYQLKEEQYNASTAATAPAGGQAVPSGGLGGSQGTQAGFIQTSGAAGNGTSTQQQ